jgi:type I restriction enzyme S subunit
MDKYEYQESGVDWLGSVPNHWPLRKLKHTVELNNSESEAEGITFKVALENIESGSGKHLGTDTPGFEGPGNVFHADDVLFSKLRPYLAKVLHAKSDGLAVGEILVLTPNKEVYDSRFLFFRLLSQAFINVVDSSTYGSKMPRASWGFIKELKLPTPPLPEQRAIAAYLDHKTAQLDTLLAQKETLLRLLHQKRQALINEAVTQGLDPAAPRKPSGVAWLGDVPAHWEVKRLKNICSVRQGLQIPIELRYTEPFEGAFEYITIRSINNPNSPKEYIKSPSLRVICDYDDILMARTGATAEVVKGVKGAFHNNFFLVDYDRAQVLKDYLYYYLTHSSVKEYLKVMAGTTTIPDLNHGEFYETVFPHPPIVEQQAIVDFIETKTGKINEATAAVYTQIKTLKAYRQSLISEVVTGKVDVRTEAQALKGTVPTPSPKEKGSQPTPPRPAAVGQLGLF